MNSMTGYGRGSARAGDREITVDLSSVNRRNLEISISLPREWQALERQISGRIRAAVGRGRVHALVQVQGEAGSGEFAWEDNAVERTLDRLEELARRHHVEVEKSGDLLLQIACLNRASGPSLPLQSAEGSIESALGDALGELNLMRAKEGAALEADIVSRVQSIRECVKSIVSVAEDVVPHYGMALLKRLAKAGLELDLDDERVLKEIAIFADRCDISEELTRLLSHLDQFEATLAEDGLIGRKLEFILQELNREVNTIGSKGNCLEISKRVFDCKNELERIREQVLNVE